MWKCENVKVSNTNANWKLATLGLATLATFTTAFAEAPQDTELTLGEVELPVYMNPYGAGYRQPSAAYPISTAKAPVAPGDAVTSISTKNAAMQWTLAAWTVGRTLSEQPPDAKLGDFCTDIPYEPGEIDWSATITANSELVSRGQILFNMGATNESERVIFTGSGATEMTWVARNGDSMMQTYSVGSSSSARPYRIFATRVDEGNTAAYIDLTGKFVKFFGDPALLQSRYKETSPGSGVSNVVYGIDYDPSKTKQLTVRYVKDEATGAIDCPQGQFVLAYYDTETKDHMVAHVVVEICPPNVNTLNAEVGDALRPAGGGFGSERLYAVAAAGLSDDKNDPYSPYLEKYSAPDGEELTDPDNGKIFAIAPTDVTTSPSGKAEPWKADVYWQTEDPMRTRWTFEHDWYLVSWPENPLRVVVAPSGAPTGCPVIVPTNYVATANGFKMPADVTATVNAANGELTLGGENGGQILVKLANENRKGCPSYLPIELTDYRAKSVATPWAFEWPVGIELTPRIGQEAGVDARAMSERIDDDLPGYIYEPESPGRNWNPRLYHKPEGSMSTAIEAPSMEELQAEAAGEGSDDDPYEDLESAIYGVNGSSAKIQVWWRANFQTPQMSKPVTYPALVQDYCVTWQATMMEGLLPEIALSSQRGSADPKMTACTGRSLLLVEKNSSASANLGGQKFTANAAWAGVSLSCYVSPDGLSEPGTLATWTFGDSFVAEAVLARGETNDYQVVITTNGVPAETYDVTPGQWATVSATLPAEALGKSVALTVGAANSSASNSATFVALDDIGLWAGASPEESDAFFNFDFTTGDLANLVRDGTVRTATDEFGNVLTCRNCSMAGAGAPGAFSLTLKAEGDATPEIYYQNDPDEIGYNPNEEHAFIDLNGDYVAWALRYDLNTDLTSKPLVLVMYPENGKGRMQAYTITKTNIDYPEMASSNLVGSALLPPAPIGRMAGCKTAIDATTAAFGFDDNSVGYRDRKNGLWARRDGIASAKYGYPMRDGFYFPSLAEQPAAGTPIAWLSCENVPSPSLDQITNIADAVNWKWTINWPEYVPELKLGQVLTKAELGLPEMWNAASMAVCYPNPVVTNLAAATVVDLIDPTVVQASSATLPVEASFPSEYGFVLGPSGTTFLRKGKYYFTGLPPSISDRFYVTVESGQAKMNLLGQYVEKESGGSYLELNVLTDSERAAIKALCVLDPSQKPKETAAWKAAAEALATKEVKPSPNSNYSGAVKSTGRKEVTLAFPSLDLYEEWAQKMTNDEEVVIEKRFTVEEFTFSNIMTPMKVVGGKKVDVSEPVAFATWHETDRKRVLVGTTRRAAAKTIYENLGLDKYLGKEWDDVSPSKYTCTVTYVKGYFTWESEEHPSANTYKARDHYALVANGSGVGYVTLIENDNPDTTQVSEGLPIQMHVIKVVPELYADGIAVLSDPLNKLSEKLTLLYRTPLGSSAAKYNFQWCYTTPNTDGTVPEKGSEPWQDRAVENGLVSVQLGETGQNLQDYVNTYYTLRYRPIKDSPTWQLLAAAHPDWTSDDDFWSPWAPEQLAEGWLQRVLNSLTPFAQRVEDFYAESSDMWFTMLEQIGRPYQGDVALNNDNLSEIGLLELYQTVFNRAESLLISAGGNNIDMSKQLMLAQTRMGEFYSLLGAEAYSDAKNPLISAGSDGQQFASGTFSFANQVSSLLDEELALLRGRTASIAYPRMTEAPLYNRLAWNMTKGISEGEPAYVANYGIRARDGILDVNCAAAQYPQGHGDAWGHYLSAISGYYRLLRNPYFDWAAAMGEMLMDQKLMNVDYQDEQKLAYAAVKLVQTGADAMDLTLRKAYKENGGDAAAAYFDSDAEQAFGYGEWATRTGLAAAYNWMTVNALLPTNDAPYQAFTDRGIAKIDRSTATQLPVLAAAVRTVEKKLAGYEAGSNPLGLSEDAIPFDIDPDRLAQKESHFEQILERAEVALANCETVLGYANEYGSRLAQISQTEEATIADVDKQEMAYNNQLIAIYGTPYSGDIGPGGTYPQGYDGPDLYNYNYMDLLPYGMLEEMQTQFTNSYKLVQAGLYGWEYKPLRDWDGTITNGYETLSINYIVNDGGIRMKPLTITGSRRMEGSIQTAYRNYISAYQKVKEAMDAYDEKLEELKTAWAKVCEQTVRFTANTTAKIVTELLKNTAWYTATDEFLIDGGSLLLDSMMVHEDMIASAVPAVQGTGMAVSIDPRAISKAISTAPNSTAFRTMMGEIFSAQASKYAKEIKTGIADGILAVNDTAQAAADTYRELETTMQGAALAVNGAVLAIAPAFGQLSAAEAAYRAEVEKGEQLQAERALWRQQVSNKATEQRYLDMYNRVQRNIALTKYTTAFDTAQRYVWELAKVYDYETGLLSSDRQSGKQFLADIIATRSLGRNGVSISSATTDGGLYDVVNRMKANWAVLKPRLGINNPDKPAKWFSLRRELFRIKQGADGDAAWRKELAKYRVDNILTDSRFIRYCQPPASQNAVVCREPGYIIPFSTSINNAENFFGKSLQFGDGQFSSADYATKIDAVGVDLVGLDQLPGGAGVEPNIYLVPVGLDYMRSPAGTDRALLSWNVVDQVLPLPYTVGSDELDATDWIATFSGLDGTSDATATIRRHSTLRAGGDFKSTRLVGRSAWNDKWIIVIPASAIDADREKAMNLIEAGVKDVKIGVRAYARQGN